MLPKAVEEFWDKINKCLKGEDRNPWHNNDIEATEILLTHPDSPVKQALDAAKKAAKHNNETIEEIGGCDHDVDICICDFIKDAEELDKALAALEVGEDNAND